MADNVRVKYPMSQDIWNTVVVDSPEVVNVDEESTTSFVVEYEFREEFDRELIRFDGKIPYEELN